MRKGPEQRLQSITWAPNNSDVDSANTKSAMKTEDRH